MQMNVEQRGNISQMLDSVDRALQREETVANDANDANEANEANNRRITLELRTILGEVYMRPFTPLGERASYASYVDRLIHLFHLDPHVVRKALRHLSTMFQSQNKAMEAFITEACIAGLTAYLLERNPQNKHA